MVEGARRGVLIDANQNGEGKTIASATRCGPVPARRLDTPSLGRGERAARPGVYTMDAVRERVRANGDLFAGVLTTRQSLGKALRSLA